MPPLSHSEQVRKRNGGWSVFHGDGSERLAWCDIIYSCLKECLSTGERANSASYENFSKLDVMGEDGRRSGRHLDDAVAGVAREISVSPPRHS